MSKYGSLIECPACGFLDRDSLDFGQHSGEENCTSCDAEIYVEVHIDVTYTTTLVKKEEKND